MIRVRPDPYTPYDHRRRAQRGTEYDLVHKLKSHPAVRTASNRAWLATKQNRLRLMGDR